jgi:hypothetical protein
MAVTPLTVTNWVRPVNNTTVARPTGTAANVSGGGNSFPNDGRTMLEIINSTADATTVTVDITKTVGGAPVTDPVISNSASIQTKWYGPLDPAIYGDTVVVTASAATVLFNVYHMP